MITIKNYYTEIGKEGIVKSKLPEALQKGWDFMDKVTLKGESLTAYETSPAIKKTIDLYLDKLNEHIGAVKKKNIEKASAKKQTTKKVAPKKKLTLDTKELNEIKKFLKTLSKDQLGSDYAYVFSGDMDRITARIHSSDESYKKHLNDFAEKLLTDEKYFKSLYSENDAYDDYFHPQKNTAKPKTIHKPTVKPKGNSNAQKVESISLELKFMKRFINMHEKIKTRNQIRLFINALQKAIREKRISKTSKYAKQIMEIQDSLIKFHGRFKSDSQREMVIYTPRTRSKYLALIGKQMELLSVKFIKSYINLQGKIIPNQKAKNLHNRIANAVNKGKLSKKDKYWAEIESVISQLKTFVQKNPSEGILRIETRTLNGLQGIVSGCSCERELNGFAQIPANTVMNSMDVVKLNFEKLGLTGKWLELIGNPSKDFTAMIYGKPKMGKSYLSVDFAGYLARNHGTVLYVAREEGIDDTLQEKLKNTKVAHPDLFVSDYLPDDLDKFDFIFLDSVTKMGLSPDELSNLKKRYPDKAFIYIFQSTKLGNFRGVNGFQHDVDVVIEIPELGKAVQFGRFNQGGTLEFFKD